MLRDCAIALSLANLLFIAAWSDQTSIDYFLKAPPRWPALLGLVADVILVAGVLVVLVRMVRRLSGPWAKWATAGARLALLGAVLMPLDWVRRETTASSFDALVRLVANPAAAVAAVGLAAGGFVLLLRYLRPVSHGAARLLLVLLPAVAVTFGSTAARLVAPSARLDAAAMPKRDAVAARSSTRIVWLLFDELDERALFVNRDPSVGLPELDKLRRQSVVATNAYSPGRQTLWSVPALIVGKPVENAKVDGLDLMLIQGRNSQPARWSREETVFSDARKAGLDTTVVGWYDSYCRVLSNDLTNCSWESYRPEADDDLTLAQGMVRPALHVLSQTMFANRMGLDERLQPEWFVRSRRARHLGSYRAVLANAIRASVAEPGLLYIHWPIPHTPVIYDRQRGEFAIDGDQTYLDNLALVDRTLGELRRAMESAGAWDAATVLVTSDHSWRKAPVQDFRVPFLLKLPHQSSQVEFASTFNTTLTRALLRSLMSGEVTRPDQLVDWLGRHRTDVPPLISPPNPVD